jgi:hypothetical protein
MTDQEELPRVIAEETTELLGRSVRFLVLSDGRRIIPVEDWDQVHLALRGPELERTELAPPKEACAVTKQELAAFTLELLAHLDYCGWGDRWEREVSEDTRKRASELYPEIHRLAKGSSP